MPFPVAFSGAASATFLPTTGGLGAGGAALFTGAAIKSPAASRSFCGGAAGRMLAVVIVLFAHAKTTFPSARSLPTPRAQAGASITFFPAGCTRTSCNSPAPVPTYTFLPGGKLSFVRAALQGGDFEAVARKFAPGAGLWGDAPERRKHPFGGFVKV